MIDDLTNDAPNSPEEERASKKFYHAAIGWVVVVSAIYAGCTAYHFLCDTKPAKPAYTKQVEETKK